VIFSGDMGIGFILILVYAVIIRALNFKRANIMLLVFLASFILFWDIYSFSFTLMLLYSSLSSIVIMLILEGYSCLLKSKGGFL
jgi:hypothetical protein